jgi:hypothetical protein
MGSHYVPQQYLRAFEVPDDPGTIWTYDKKHGTCKRLPIKNIAQAPGFYPPDVEAELNSKLEGPANSILAQLTNLRPISQEQQVHFAFYIAGMIKRVPRRRRISREETLPKALKNTMDAIMAEVQEFAATTSNREMADRRVAEVQRLREKFSDEPPAGVIEQIESPWPTKKMAEAVLAMTWRIVFTKGPQYVITSDNPAFFFEGLGVGTPDSEIAFPLSPSVALMGSRQGKPGEMIFVEIKQKIVREVNRRMAAGAERLIFAREQQPWLPAAMAKPHAYLSKIAW